MVNATNCVDFVISLQGDGMWSKLYFGKHAGRSLPQTLFSDPDYFFWSIEKNIFKGHLAMEANKLTRMVRHIRIPKQDPENWCVQYFLTTEHKFSRFQIIPTNREPHTGSSITRRTRHIDMSVIRQGCRYDKGGYKRFLKSLKYHLFGNSSIKMTAARCEEFFDDDDNFAS
jgi:hypothetical protein